MGVDATRTVRIDFLAEDKGVADVASGIKGQLIAVAAVAGVATKALDALGDETARLDKIAKGAQQTGLGFDAYQRLAQVSKLAGTNVDILAKGTIRLTRNLNDLASGRGEKVADNLKRLGLTLADLQDQSPTEQLAILSDALVGVESDAQKTAIAVELFGRSGAELVPLLNAGSDAIRELEANVGKVFTREELARAEAYQDALANLEKASADLAGTIAVEAAPAIQSLVEDATQSARALGESREFAEGLEFAIGRLEATIGPVVKVVGFFTDQLAMLGNAANLVADEVISAGGQIIGALDETRAADWAREAAGAFEDLGIETGDLTDSIKDQFPALEGLQKRWSVLQNTITNTSEDQGKFLTAGQKLLGGLLSEATQLAREQEKAGTNRVELLEREVAEAEHAVNLAEARRRPNAEIESLLRAQHQAKVDLLAATGDQLGLEKELRSEEVRLATRRGGRGPARAERLLALGEQQIAVLEQQARLSALLARSDDDRAEQQILSLDAQRERLQLERQALDLRRASGEFARQQLENEKAAVEFQLETVDVERMVAVRERERQQLAEITSIEQARSEAEASAAARRFEMLGREFEAREVIRQQQEQALLANPPEDEIGRIERMDALQQIAFDREMDRRERAATEAQARAELEERLHAEELKRIEEKQRKQKAAVDATSRFLSTGQQFASAVIGAAIKDEEKRAQAELKARGVMAIATGALEVVRAASSFASFNFVEGALHTAAAALAFTQGGIMLSGNLPGTGGTGGISAPAAAPRADRETGEAARIVESIPAADREPARQPTTQQQGGGNVTNIENLNVTGAIDDETVEKIRIGLDNVNNGLEEAV